jgi:hypothetical protein
VEGAAEEHGHQDREGTHALHLIGHRLKVLRHARLVDAEKQGVFVTDRVADGGVAGLFRALRRLAEERLAEVQEIARAFVETRGSLEAVEAPADRPCAGRGSDVARRAASGRVPGGAHRGGGVRALKELESRLASSAGSSA